MATVRNARRQFLGLCTNLLMGLLSLLVAIPVVAYLVGPLRRKYGDEGGAAFHDVGHLSDIPVRQWRLVTLETVREDGWKATRTRHAIWVHRSSKSDQGIVVLSSLCPHLGCPINWHVDRSEFMCPCHGGVFSADGKLIAGPPPRSMDRLEYEVRAGRLWVRWQDFKIGVTERVPVSV